jgi:hypothetical protein
MNVLQDIACIPANIHPVTKRYNTVNNLFLSLMHPSDNIIITSPHREHNIKNVNCLSERLPSQVFSSCPRPDKPFSLTWRRPGEAVAKPAQKPTQPGQKVKSMYRSFFLSFFCCGEAAQPASPFTG